MERGVSVLDCVKGALARALVRPNRPRYAQDTRPHLTRQNALFRGESPAVFQEES